MFKSVEKMSLNYSPNFDREKRPVSKIKYIIIHYTGMKNEIQAIKRLTDHRSKVSCHYFIKKNGNIIKMVPDNYTSWHAGVSFWKHDKFLNNKSIGIEISNPGHQYNYLKFLPNQISSLIKLIKKLKKKYKIKKTNILGHSDIAPIRKKDPGEKFPWKYLSENNIGLWHNLDETQIKKLRNKKFKQKKIFFDLLFKFGYMNSNKTSERNKIVKSFQRRFRPNLINGIIDEECYKILKNLSFR